MAREDSQLQFLLLTIFEPTAIFFDQLSKPEPFCEGVIFGEMSQKVILGSKQTPNIEFGDTI